MSPVNLFLYTWDGIVLDDGKLCPWGNLFFLKMPKEKLPVKGGQLDGWRLGWSHFKFWTHHLV